MNMKLAILHTEGYRYLGAKTDMVTWNPHVEADDEYSTSRVALMSGAYYDYQDIESGWAVSIIFSLTFSFYLFIIPYNMLLGFSKDIVGISPNAR